MAIIKFEGREIPLDDAIASSDELLKQALIPHLGAEIANAQISREEKGGQMVVTLLKRAGPKGAFAGFSGLMQAPEQVNPIFGLAWMLRWNDARGTLNFLELYEIQELLDTAIAQGEEEDRHTQHALRQLKQYSAQATPGHIVIGF